MNQPKNTLRPIYFFLLLLFFLGLIYSFFLQSVAVIFLVGLAFLDESLLPTKRSFHLFFNSYRLPVVWGFAFLFLGAVIPSVAGTDWAFYVEKLVIKLPFVLLPAAFIKTGLPDKRMIARLAFWASVILCIQCLFIFADFLTNPEWWADNLKRGKSLITPGNHIRFSVVIALLVLHHVHILLFSSKKGLKHLYFNVTSTLIFILFLHFLSVRSGLLVLYAGMSVLIGFFVIEKKGWLTAVAIGTALVALPVLFYQTVDIFRNKVDYMVYDIRQFKEGNGSNYADSGRLVSLITGLKVFSTHPIVGSGNNGIRQATSDIIAADYPHYPKDLLPHNQFVFALSSGGVFGLICLILGLFLPFFARRLFDRPLPAAILAALFTLCMIDHPLEVTTGVGMVLFFFFWAKSDEVHPA